ncbi:MAG: hypothetical protein IT303_09385 [Dehalococcoidia bacterium]|nr:hypothetical protein [Dehalococcoidia bacterium]
MATPDDATWAETAFEADVRRAQADIEESEAEYQARFRAMVERGRADARAGRSSTTDEVRARLGLPPLAIRTP